MCVGPNIPYVPLFIYMSPYLTLIIYIYLDLPLFAHISPLIALI